MSTTKLVRLSGLSLMMGGVAIFIHYLTHPQGEAAEYVALPLWIPSHWIGFLAWSLILMGLVGLYVHQSEKSGVLGLITFVFAFVSGMLDGGGNFWGGGVFQVLYPNFADPGGLYYISPFARLAVVLSDLWILAFPLFAIVTLRAGMLPRVGAWLVILLVPFAIVGVAMLPTNPTLAFGIAIVASAIYGLGLIIWGRALWSTSGENMVKTASVR